MYWHPVCVLFGEGLLFFQEDLRAPWPVFFFRVRESALDIGEFRALTVTVLFLPGVFLFMFGLSTPLISDFKRSKRLNVGSTGH